MQPQRQKLVQVFYSVEVIFNLSQILTQRSPAHLHFNTGNKIQPLRIVLQRIASQAGKNR